MNQIAESKWELFKTCVLSVIFVFAAALLQAQTIGLFYDFSTPQYQFAASDIKTALEDNGFSVEVIDIEKLNKRYNKGKVVIALQSNDKVKTLLKKAGGVAAPLLGEQAYAIRTTTQPELGYWVMGGDHNGAMYGALQMAENINFNGFSGAYNEEESPYLMNRGIKFNIPLDIEAPTYFYDSRGASNQLAIKHVWDSTFWFTWFDEMARHRYNVLSLWCPHPFTAILNMEDEYPGIAIPGVTGFDEDGNTVKINNWTIDEKVAYWQKVMKYGHDRGFKIFFCTWNIFLSTAEGKYGLTDDPDNYDTRTYLNRCTKKLLETYPHLTGIGVTVGENMNLESVAEKEEWAWDSYGSAMFEYAKANPDREMVFIHRLLMSDIRETVNNFKPLIEIPNVRFDLSYKYSMAHAHAAVKPTYWNSLGLEDQLDEAGVWSWLTVRNDDFFFLHWADPQFVRDYVNHFPEVGRYVNAIYIGPDGWVFSRVFTSKDPYYESKNALSIQKTWYMQKIWGRIAYNPSVSDDLFKDHLGYQYPEVSSDKLFTAWSNASRAIKLVNEQVTGTWSLDFHWWPEGHTRKGYGYNTIEDALDVKPQRGSNLCDFKNSAWGNCNDKISAVDNADHIEQLATEALQLLKELDPGSNKELSLNLTDLKAMSYLSLFNAYKFRAIVYVGQGKIAAARNNMIIAYCNWKEYTSIMDEMYFGFELQRNHHFDNWHDHDADVLKEVTNLGGPEFIDCSDMYPWVKIAAPYNNSKFIAPADMTVEVNAETGSNSAGKVELRSNGVLVGSDIEFPFTFKLEDQAVGNHTLSARLYDSQGRIKDDTIHIAVFDSASINTVPWIEDFTLPNLTSVDWGLTSWTSKRQEGIFTIKDNSFMINDGGDEGVLRTGEIDIAGGPVVISMDILSTGGLDDNDYVNLYKIVDGGDEILLGSLQNKRDEIFQITGSATGSKLVLVIRSKVSASDEVYYLDNLSVRY